MSATVVCWCGPQPKKRDPPLSTTRTSRTDLAPGRTVDRGSARAIAVQRPTDADYGRTRARGSVARQRVLRHRPRRARVALQRIGRAGRASTRTPRTPGWSCASTSTASPLARARASGPGCIERLGPGRPGGGVGLALPAPQPGAGAGAAPGPPGRRAAGRAAPGPHPGQAVGQGEAAEGQAPAVRAQARPEPARRRSRRCVDTVARHRAVRGRRGAGRCSSSTRRCGRSCCRAASIVRLTRVRERRGAQACSSCGCASPRPTRPATGSWRSTARSRCSPSSSSGSSWSSPASRSSSWRWRTSAGRRRSIQSGSSHVHPRLRAADRLLGRDARLRRGGHRPRAARAPDRVPADDLRRVLAAGGARRAHVGARGHAAERGGPPAPRVPHRAGSTTSTTSGSSGSSGSPSCRRRTRRCRS